MVKHPNTPGMDESLRHDLRLWDGLSPGVKRRVEASPQCWGARSISSMWRKWGDVEGTLFDFERHDNEETQYEGRAKWPDWKEHPQCGKPFVPIECKPVKRTVRERRAERLAGVKLTQLRRGS